jgi:hypothetical protein
LTIEASGNTSGTGSYGAGGVAVECLGFRSPTFCHGSTMRSIHA